MCRGPGELESNDLRALNTFAIPMSGSALIAATLAAPGDGVVCVQGNRHHTAFRSDCEVAFDRVHLGYETSRRRARAVGDLRAHGGGHHRLRWWIWPRRRSAVVEPGREQSQADRLQ